MAQDVCHSVALDDSSVQMGLNFIDTGGPFLQELESTSGQFSVKGGRGVRVGAACHTIPSLFGEREGTRHVMTSQTKEKFLDVSLVTSVRVRDGCDLIARDENAGKLCAVLTFVYIGSVVSWVVDVGRERSDGDAERAIGRWLTHEEAPDGANHAHMRAQVSFR